jgi:hypothetical protein
MQIGIIKASTLIRGGFMISKRYSGEVLDTVLLLALPASGKSEVRKYLAGLSGDECRRAFHMGPTVQLDDFPYVHMMRQLDDQLAARGKSRFFFSAPDRPFRNPRHWGTLIELINEDYADLINHRTYAPKSAALHLIERIDGAAKKIGAPAVLDIMDDSTRHVIADALEREALELLKEKNSNSMQNLAGKTVVIEFARGGAQGASLPLPEPFGYGYSLSRLSKSILERASILYIWVTPEESRRKNEARANPNDPGSILHHGVPIDVMLNDYGCDDMSWLESKSETPDTVSVRLDDQAFTLPIARFDNRMDKTSFVRADVKDWKASDVKALHDGLQQAFEKLAKK